MMNLDKMTLQQIIETVPHALLEEMARFCGDPTLRQCIVHKGEGDFKCEYKVIKQLRLNK